MIEHISAKELRMIIPETSSRLQNARRRRATAEIRYLELVRAALNDLALHHEEDAERERRELQARSEARKQADDTQAAFQRPWEGTSEFENLPRSAREMREERRLRTAEHRAARSEALRRGPDYPEATSDE